MLKLIKILGNDDLVDVFLDPDQEFGLVLCVLLGAPCVLSTITWTQQRRLFDMYDNLMNPEAAIATYLSRFSGIFGSLVGRSLCAKRKLIQSPRLIFIGRHV